MSFFRHKADQIPVAIFSLFFLADIIIYFFTITRLVLVGWLPPLADVYEDSRAARSSSSTTTRLAATHACIIVFTVVPRTDWL